MYTYTSFLFDVKALMNRQNTFYRNKSAVKKIRLKLCVIQTTFFSPKIDTHPLWYTLLRDFFFMSMLKMLLATEMIHQASMNI